MDNEIKIPETVNSRRGPSKQRHPNQDVKPITNTISSRQEGNSKFEPAAIPIELPSHGKLYKNISEDADIQNGVIKIRQMTMREEKILTTDRFIQNGKALDMILENCIKSPINPLDLLSGDRLYILFYLRGMSYGLDYDFNVRCYHCQHDFIQTVTVDSLPIKEWEDDVEEPFEFTLPISKYNVKMHFMRGSEENKLLQSSREMKGFNEPDNTALESILLLVDEISDPDGNKLNKFDKEDFLNNLVTGDTETIREELEKRDCGIQPIKNVFCPKCNRQLEFNVPLGRNFFRSRGRG
jgi:hypothetical protein